MNWPDIVAGLLVEIPADAGMRDFRADRCCGARKTVELMRSDARRK
jgi:hypothetical protein